MNNKSILIILFLLLFSWTGFSQSDQINSAIITLPDVQVHGKKIKHPFIFSTFTNNPFGTSHFTYINGEYYTKNISSLFVGIKVNNIYNQKIRVDSVFIKGHGLDTNQIKLIFNIYQNGKLYKSSQPQFKSKKKSIYKFIFKDNLNFPSGSSYFSFSFQMKTNRGFKIITNKKIKGFLYSYNEKNDIFKLIDDKVDKDYPIQCPQIKLFYTLLPTP